MGELRHDRGVGSTIRGKLVRDNDTWHILQALHQLSEETLGGCCIVSFLNKEIEHFTFLIHGASQVDLVAIDLQENFIQMPRITITGTTVTQTACILVTKFQVHNRIASCDTSTPRSNIISCTSRKLKQNRKKNQTCRLIISRGIGNLHS